MILSNSDPSGERPETIFKAIEGKIVCLNVINNLLKVVLCLFTLKEKVTQYRPSAW